MPDGFRARASSFHQQLDEDGYRHKNPRHIDYQHYSNWSRNPAARERR
jgi:hypothetical protein